MWGENCNFIYCPSLDKREALNTKEYLQFTNIRLSNEDDKAENSSGVRREMWVRVCTVRVPRWRVVPGIELHVELSVQLGVAVCRT